MVERPALGVLPHDVAQALEPLGQLLLHHLLQEEAWEEQLLVDHGIRVVPLALPAHLRRDEVGGEEIKRVGACQRRRRQGGGAAASIRGESSVTADGGGTQGHGGCSRQLVEFLEHEHEEPDLLRVGLQVDEDELPQQLLPNLHVRRRKRLLKHQAEMLSEVGEALRARLQAHLVELLEEHLAALRGEDVRGHARGGADDLRGEGGKGPAER